MLPQLVDEVIAAVQDAVPAYAGAFDRGVRRGVHQALEGFLELIAAAERAQLPAREVYVDFGRAQVRAGRTLEDLLTAYRAGARVAWRVVARAGDRAGLEPRSLYTLAEGIFAYIDQLSAASAEGFAAEQSRVVGERREHQRRLLELLLRDPQPPAEVEQAARMAGWAPSEQVAVVAFDENAAGYVSAALSGSALVASLGGLGFAVVADPDGPGRRAELKAALGRTRAAVGHSVPSHEAARSARRAELALELATPGELVVADEHLLELLLRSDPTLARDLARKRLSGFEALPPARRKRLLETLRVWLDSGGHAPVAAGAMHVHVQTVRYRLGQLRDILGPALDDPDARLELELALRARSD